MFGGRAGAHCRGNGGLSQRRDRRARESCGPDANFCKNSQYLAMPTELRDYRAIPLFPVLRSAAAGLLHAGLREFCNRRKTWQPVSKQGGGA